MGASISLKELLADNTMAAAPELTQQEADGTVRCLACGHRCLIKEGRQGICRVRFNLGGQLRAPAGYVAGLQIDPIEKKPFYHVFPGRDALSFGMLGCCFHCGFCQNWITSQTLRDDRAVSRPNFITAEALVEAAVGNKVPVIVSTYNEPLITTDWAIEIFKLAKPEGIVCGYVSNGNATPEVLEFIRPYVDLYKIDLKCFDEKAYQSLGGVLQNVLDTIRRAWEMGYWVEVVTLVVPGFNDLPDELKKIAGFLAGVSCDIPWHATAFHPDYKMTGPPATPGSKLIEAYDIGRAAGLRYVYAGNQPGAVGERENTYCPNCNELLIRRYGFYVEDNRMVADTCNRCGQTIAGRWEDVAPSGSSGTGMPRPVSP